MLFFLSLKLLKPSLLLLCFGHERLELTGLHFLLHLGIVELVGLLARGRLDVTLLLAQTLKLTFLVPELRLKLLDALLKVTSFLG